MFFLISEISTWVKARLNSAWKNTNPHHLLLKTGNTGIKSNLNKVYIKKCEYFLAETWNIVKPFIPNIRIILYYRGIIEIVVPPFWWISLVTLFSLKSLQPQQIVKHIFSFINFTSQSMKLCPIIFICEILINLKNRPPTNFYDSIVHIHNLSIR